MVVDSALQSAGSSSSFGVIKYSPSKLHLEIFLAGGTDTGSMIILILCSLEKAISQLMDSTLILASTRINAADDNNSLCCCRYSGVMRCNAALVNRAVNMLPSVLIMAVYFPVGT